MTKMNDIKLQASLRPATADDLNVGARVFYKTKAWSLNCGWCTIARIAATADPNRMVEIKGAEKNVPSRDLNYLWVGIDRLWVLKDRVMFRVEKKTGEVSIALLDTEQPDEKSGRKWMLIKARNHSAEVWSDSYIGTTRGLQTNGERNRAQVMLQELEAETKTSYRVKTRR